MLSSQNSLLHPFLDLDGAGAILGEEGGMMRLGFGLVAEFAYVNGAVRDVNKAVAYFRDSLGDILIAGDLNVEVHNGSSDIGLRLEPVRLACNDLNNNVVLGSGAWDLCV